MLPALFLCLATILPGKIPGKQGPVISIVTDATLALPAKHGLEQLTQALTAQNISYEKVSAPTQATGKYLLFAGLSKGPGPAAASLQTAHHSVIPTAEAFSIWHTVWRQRPTIVISGYDSVGLMYALQEAARQFRRATDAGTAFV